MNKGYKSRRTVAPLLILLLTAMTSSNAFVFFKKPQWLQQFLDTNGTNHTENSHQSAALDPTKFMVYNES